MKSVFSLAFFVVTVEISSGRINSPHHVANETAYQVTNETKNRPEIFLRDLKSGYCGWGKVRSGVCEDSNLCCSKYGWCGNGAAHCQNNYCGGGTVGNGICANQNLCCSEYGYCGSSPDHCGGTKGTASTDSASSSGAEAAFLTYHMYYAGQPLTQVSCSDGTNGLITRWGHSTVDPMFPYVAATSNLNWNSPVCGTCYKVYSPDTKKTIYVTTIDKVGNPGPNGELHFDLAYEAFIELLGNDGYLAGMASATYEAVSSSYCKGNGGRRKNKKELFRKKSHL